MTPFILFAEILLSVVLAVIAHRHGIRRDTNNAVFGGVCSGVAQHFNLPANALRILVVATSLIMGFGLFLYLVMWLVVSEK